MTSMDQQAAHFDALNQTPVALGNNVWMIDLFEQGHPCRSAAYLILDEKITLIETGSAKSHDVLLSAMAKLGVKPVDLGYVIVTHVHLDHAGGAGQMMEKATSAKLVVHPRGARHMIDPSRLWAGTSQVYGERIHELFGSMVPVPEEKIVIGNHLDTLAIGKRTLTFFDSPGHAKHHFTILDKVSDALYAGDAVGIRYRTCYTGWNFEWVMPSSAPADFDPVAVHKTAAMLRDVPFSWVYHTHFGRSPKEEAIRETERWADGMAELIHRVYEPGIDVTKVISALREWIAKDLRQQGYNPGSDIEVLDFDVLLDALGLIYFEERNQTAQ